MKEKNAIYKITLLNDYGDNICQLKTIDFTSKYDENMIIISGNTVDNKEFHILTSKHSAVIEEE